MFTRSKGLFLSLVALLGVFSFSSTAYADTSYEAIPVNSYYNSKFSGDSPLAAVYQVGVSQATKPFASWYTDAHVVSATLDSVTVRAFSPQKDSWSTFVIEIREVRTVSGSYNSTSADELASSQCESSRQSTFFYYDAETRTCVLEEPSGDSDADGIINELDPDSGLYDPNYCIDNPDLEHCSDDSDGGDSGGGDTGGGSGGGTWSPPVGSECTTEVDSQSCCTDYGQFYCQDKGGLVSADWTDLGGLSCSVTCSDDVIDPPTDGGGGDDSGGDDSGGTGDSFDDSGIVSSIQNASAENSTALNSLQTEITSGFSDVSSDIVDMNNNLATGINGVGSELSTLNDTASDIRSNTAETASAVSELENSLSDIFTINPDTIDGGFDPDSANTDANEYFDGVFSTGDLEDRTGLDSGVSLDTRTIDISEFSADFQPMLGGSSTECPAPYELNIAGTTTSISFEAVCDAFAILSIFVQAAAWFATPFIILGVSKG